MMPKAGPASATGQAVEQIAQRLSKAVASPWGAVGDLSVAALDASGRVIDAAGAIRHRLAVTAIVESVQRQFQTDLAPGDVVVHNDPYTGGTSMMDLSAVAVDQRDGDRRFGVARMRVEDVGGGQAGGVFSRAGQIIQEGDRVPPVRIVEEGRVLKDLVRRIAVNTRRRSHHEHDLNCLREAAEAAARSIRLVDGGNYPQLDAVPIADTAGAATVVVKGDLVRRPRRVVVRVLVRDGCVAIDFDDTDGADEGPGNVPWSATVASAVEAVYEAIGKPATPEALSRSVTCSAPDGSFVRPLFPAACSAGGIYTTFAIREAVARALGDAGLPRIEWPTWSAGAVLAGRPAADYLTLVPLDCPSIGAQLDELVPGVSSEILRTHRWGREVRVSASTDAGLRLTAWRMQIQGEGPADSGASVYRAALPATCWLPSIPV